MKYKQYLIARAHSINLILSDETINSLSHKGTAPEFQEP
jgi:hypothetical protein